MVTNNDQERRAGTTLGDRRAAGLPWLHRRRNLRFRKRPAGSGHLRRQRGGHSEVDGVCFYSVTPPVADAAPEPPQAAVPARTPGESTQRSPSRDPGHPRSAVVASRSTPRPQPASLAATASSLALLFVAEGAPTRYRFARGPMPRGDCGGGKPGYKQDLMRSKKR